MFLSSQAKLFLALEITPFTFSADGKKRIPSKCSLMFLIFQIVVDLIKTRNPTPNPPPNKSRKITVMNWTLENHYTPIFYHKAVQGEKYCMRILKHISFSTICKCLCQIRPSFYSESMTVTWMELIHTHHRTCSGFYYSTAPCNFYAWVYLVDWVVLKHNV